MPRLVVQRTLKKLFQLLLLLYIVWSTSAIIQLFCSRATFKKKKTTKNQLEFCLNFSRNNHFFFVEFLLIFKHDFPFLAYLFFAENSKALQLGRKISFCMQLCLRVTYFNLPRLFYLAHVSGGLFTEYRKRKKEK